MGGSTPPPHCVDVCRALGGGSVADLLLWRRWLAGVALLLSSTAMWFLFERAGYNLLSFATNTLFLLVLILFLWAKSAALLNRGRSCLICSFRCLLTKKRRLNRFLLDDFPKQHLHWLGTGVE
ncbi:hypothetical protein NL676_015738 [Syzygium grande]|nr:hypothetical protein NL676_015738 [Syzygium grande]